MDLKNEEIKILVVDDDKIALKIIKRCLTQFGYTDIICADNGKAALDELNNQNFSLLLCDVLMPDIDGFKILQHVREDLNLPGLPVIMISATEDLGTVYKCIQAGADDYLVKPINKAMLKNLWSSVWRKKHEKRVIDELNEEKVISTKKDEELDLLNEKLADLSSKVEEAVSTPVAVITRTIGDLLNTENLTEEVKTALKTVIKSLASSNLYKPVFNDLISKKEQEIDPMIKQWLRSEYDIALTDSGSNNENNEDVENNNSDVDDDSDDNNNNNYENDDNSENTLAIKKREKRKYSLGKLDDVPENTIRYSINRQIVFDINCIPPKMIESLFEIDISFDNLERLDFDLWSYSMDELLPLIAHFFDRFDLINKFKIDRKTLYNFIIQTRESYNSSNPYHNFRHAFDVTQVVFSFLTTCNANEYFSDIEILSLLISCLCHDLGHPGINNNFLSATNDILALQYNDKSILENYHSFQTFRLLQIEDCNILKTIPKSDVKSIRKDIIENILATDMARHIEILNKYESIVGSFDKTKKEHLLLLKQIMVKTADIYNPAKVFSQCKYWAELVQEEFFKQGDNETALGLPISPFMNREDSDLPKMQIGFAKFFIVPLLNLLNQVVSIPTVINQLNTNINNWTSISQLTKND